MGDRIGSDRKAGVAVVRRAARTDANKTAIVSALRSYGCSVYDLKQPVDLLVGIHGRTELVEVKDGEKPPSDRELTPAQKAFIATWNGASVKVVNDVDGALRIARALAFGVEV